MTQEREGLKVPLGHKLRELGFDVRQNRTQIGDKNSEGQAYSAQEKEPTMTQMTKEELVKQNEEMARRLEHFESMKATAETRVLPQRQQPTEVRGITYSEAVDAVENGIARGLEKAVKDKNFCVNLFQRSRLEKLEDAGWTALGVGAGLGAAAAIGFGVRKIFGAP